MISLGYGMLGSLNNASGEHHVVSVNPLGIDTDLSSLAGRYTLLEDFYVRNHGEVPRPPETSFLLIEGEVEKPRKLTGGDLASLRKTKVGAVLECAGDPVLPTGLVSNGLWEGWSLESVLSLVRPTPTGTYLHLFGRDGYARSVPTDRARRDGMLVTHLNGQPLRRSHGAPWRAVFPGWYGMDSVKWLERIAVATAPLPPNGYTYLELTKNEACGLTQQPLPRVQVKSVITHPENGSVVHFGSIPVQGLAWSGEGPISKVEISSDRGVHWRIATLDAGGRYEWVLWRASLDLSRPGVAELISRATDARGQTQPEQRNPERLDGYVNNWYHRVQVVVE
jgi:DMSO/TMAO reductase YedYZ molybdopterin-dependent catalytic subunit